MDQINKEPENNRKRDFDFDEFLVKKCKWHLRMSENEKKSDPHFHQEL
jgi:hypothetical protein